MMLIKANNDLYIRFIVYNSSYNEISLITGVLHVVQVYSIQTLRLKVF